MTQKKAQDQVADRRSFLKFAGASAAASGVALVTGEAKAQSPAEAPKQALYRETEHIRRYYELAR